jgi:hypothetical protein
MSVSDEIVLDEDTLCEVRSDEESVHSSDDDFIDDRSEFSSETHEEYTEVSDKNIINGKRAKLKRITFKSTDFFDSDTISSSGPDDSSYVDEE